MIKKLLTGHSSPETAFVVDSYPYGFKLRCKIRYWIEHKNGFGFRFCSQTTNPKKGDRWNKPKVGTYCDFLIMGFDENEHVVNHAVRSHDSPEKFGWVLSLDLTPYQRDYVEKLKEIGKQYFPNQWNGSEK